MTIWSGVKWSIWQYASDYDVWYTPKMWLEIFVLFAWNLSYAALYDLTKMLYNPFGSRRIDVAHDAIGQGVAKLARGLAAATPHIPDTMQFNYDAEATSRSDSLPPLPVKFVTR